MKRILILGGLLLLMGASLYAQTIRVTGRVTDATDGTALPGVTVLLQGTTQGVATDANGNFTLDVPANGVLVFSFVGMTSATVPIEGRTVVNVALEREALTIDEFVFTGYSLQRRRDLTGSLASVRGETLEMIPISSIDRALQGRAAGVQVTAASGIPGGAVSVVIRGIGSFGSAAPLYIIDGVQVQSGDVSRSMTSSNTLAGLNPEDIESIEVLKDASATAIYGSRGANGVVIITTKRGRQQDDGGTRFDLQVSRGFSRNIQQYDVLSGPEWVQLDLEAFANRWGRTHVRYTDNRQWLVNQGWLGFDPVAGTYDFNFAPTFNWQDEVYRPGVVQDIRLSASGGQRTRFFVSGSFNQLEGHVLNTHMTRGTLRVNLDHDINNNLRLENNTSMSVFGQNTVASGGAFSNPVRSGWQVVPMNPIYNPDGSYFGIPNFVFGTLRFNVIHDALVNHNKGLTAQIVQSNALNWRINDYLTYRGFIGMDVNDVVEDMFWHPQSGDGAATQGMVQALQTRFFIWQTSNTLNFNRTFGGRHQVGALAGVETFQRLVNSISASGNNVPQHFSLLSAVAIPMTASAGFSDFKMMGIFGRLNYTFNDRYIATFSIRTDGNSRFGADNRWGTFPAASLGWRISSERFMDWSENWLDNLMLRVSYGIAGSDAAIGDFTARSLYGPLAYQGRSGIIPTVFPNPELTWEESSTLNLGISLTAFRGRMNLDVDAYHRETSKLLMSRPLPPSTGWTGILQNIGAMENQGIEVTLNTVNIASDNFRWSTDFNFATLHNVITRLLPGQDYLNTRTMVGRSLNDWFIHEFAGVNPADGRPMYYDIDGNITYQPRFEDRRWFGPQNPTRYGGITNTFQVGNSRLGNLIFSFFLQYSGGNVRNNTERQFGFRSGNTGDRNQFQYVFDNRWRNPGDMTFVPRPMQASAYGGTPASFFGLNSMSLEKVDYLRLKDVSLTYELPRSLVERARFTSLQIFAQATNLLTWTTYTGLDPEFTGDDFGVYPQGKMITFGIRSSF
ncbi:MAG TPA: TonB-dependent receptor [Bacteroidales bacterium]|nr:TonB-dependent receptor [Bacteroidales bacterium]